MAERFDLLGLIEDRLDPEAGEHSDIGRLPFGMLETHLTRWVAHAQGESDVEYVLEVERQERRGRMASLFRSEPFTTAKLIMQGQQASAAYIARLKGEQVVYFEGAVRPMGRAEDVRPPTPRPLSYEEAAIGFRTSLEDARFV